MKIKPTSYLFAIALFIAVAFALQSQSNDPPVIPPPGSAPGYWAWFVANWDKILSILTAIVGLFAIKGRAAVARAQGNSVSRSVFRGEQVPNQPKP